jgi:hypothetical protein
LPPSSPPTAFVLMPFEDNFTAVYTGLIKPPLVEAGFVVQRADSLVHQQQILKDIVKGIAEATLIVADVTGLNENVLYELGLAHALGKRVVMITQDISGLPFDLRAYRVNEYSVVFDKANELSSTLKDVGVAVLKGEADFSNPVQDFAPWALGGQAQVNFSGTPAAPPPTVSDPSDVVEPTGDDEEPGWLELVYEMHAGTAQAVEAMTEIGRLSETIGAKLQQHTARLNTARANLGESALGPRLTIAREAARDIEDFSDAIEVKTEILRTALGKTTIGANALAREGRIGDDGDAAAVASLIESLKSAEDGMRVGRDGIEQMASIMAQSPNFERSFNRAAKRAAAAVTVTANVIQDAEAEIARARELLAERLDMYQASADGNGESVVGADA